MNELTRLLIIFLIVLFFGWLCGLFAIDQVETLTSGAGYGYL